MVHHLKEKEVEWLRKSLEKLVRDRQKRELLGELLTSVFGVNDEVYHDIEALDKNQHELIRTSTHQTKIMLQALATFNDTENRIQNRLKRFQEKLNEGI
mgnify:FL=1